MIYLTGCSGLIGSAVFAKLLDMGIEVKAVDDLSFGDERNIPNGAMWHEVDFEKLFLPANTEEDTLIHLATSNIVYAMDNPVKTFENNALKTIRLFERFQGKVVYTSTASVYGHADRFPTPENAEIKVSNAYDMSKLIVEHYLKSRGNFTTLRLSNVYGANQRSDNPYSGAVGKMIGKAINNEPIDIYGNGMQTRDFTYIDDVVEAIIQATMQPSKNVPINIATGREAGILIVARMIIEATGSKSEINYLPKRTIDGINNRCLSIERANYELGWIPKTTLEEGIKRTISWARNER